ncbi:hypothetical protein [Streptomyces sp. NBC_00009]|uniref:hypothetical protein n=1 Tax=Streptomyces sp. NBC_00009 TaxID=2975620 RepID=UPI00324676D8
MKTLHARPPIAQIRFAAAAQGQDHGPSGAATAAHGRLIGTAHHSSTTIALLREAGMPQL